MISIRYLYYTFIKCINVLQKVMSLINRIMKYIYVIIRITHKALLSSIYISSIAMHFFLDLNDNAYSYER